jgi:hypothetical protein
LRLLRLLLLLLLLLLLILLLLLLMLLLLLLARWRGWLASGAPLLADDGGARQGLLVLHGRQRLDLVERGHGVPT